MIYTGARSALAVAKQGATTYVKIPYSSEGLKYNLNYVDSEALVGKRGTYAYGQTSVGVDGDISFEAFPQSLTWGMYAVLGKVTASTTVKGVPITYTITPIGVSDSLPKYNIQVNYTGASTYTYKFTDIKIGQLTLNLSNNAVPKVSLTAAGVNRETGSTISPSLHSDDSKPFFVKDIIVKAGDTLITLPDLTSLDLTINNNFDTDTVVLDGTGLRKDIIEQKLDITGTINALFTDDNNGTFQKFKDLYESGDTTKIYAKISNSEGNSVEITLNNIYIKEFSHNVGGSGKIPLNVSFTAVNTSNTMIEVISSLNKDSDLI